MENKKIINIQKLTDISLENVSGGLSDRFISISGYANLALGLLGGIGYSIGGCVCSHKAHIALQECDITTAEKYANLAKGFAMSATISSCQAALGVGGLVIRKKLNKH